MSSTQLGGGNTGKMKSPMAIVLYGLGVVALGLLLFDVGKRTPPKSESVAVETHAPAAPVPAPASATIEAPLLETPAHGATMDNGRADHADYQVWEFSWRPVPHASQYNLYVKNPIVQMPVINQITQDPHFRKAGYGNYVVNQNRLGWTWKVRAFVGGTWGPWSETRTFDFEPIDTDPPVARDGQQ